MPLTQLDGGRQIKAATITNVEIAAAAAIATTKLSNGADFIQRGGSVPFTADQSHGGFKITNVAIPVSATDGATKGYVDGVAQGLDTKASVRAATTANGTLASAFANASVVDGVTLATGDRILLKDQSVGSENGIYTVNATGTPTRATDADTNTEVTAGMYVFVEEGTANADNGFVLTNNGAIILGTTALVFAQFSGAGSVIGGAGLTRTGTTLDVIGTTNRIVVAADSIDIGTDVVTLTGAQTLTNKSITGAQISSAVANATLAVEATAALGIKTTTTTVSTSASVAPTSGQILIATSGTAATWQSPAGAPTFRDRETPSGLVNGANTAYTLAFTPVAGSEHIYLNGILQEPGAGNDYTISGSAITYLAAPVTGDKVRASYRS